MSAQSDLPEPVRTVESPRTLDTLRTFPTIHSLAEWTRRREFIRTRILISCGLYPLPPKTPLHAHLFGRVERDGYTIEKVYFQTFPGFYLAGNLYRPLRNSTKGQEAEGNRHSGKFPGALVTHGHWDDGRMADGPDGSIAARAITFARQGYVAFTYDMVGYNDTHQIDHNFGNDARHWLWGVTLMGLQTWNSIRALDFLSSLPDVDTKRLAITGESGGGTQTMMLGAIDDRLAAVGPCVMVSHSMQGGCLCENAPGLRIDFSNMEIAAAAAPRPQIMVGATGDWTRDTMTVEGPAVESIYRLYNKPANLKYVLFNYGHNINKTSREAVYAFFGEHLLHVTDAAHSLLEPPYHKEPTADLRVFPDGAPLPPDAKNAEALTADLIALSQSELERHKPHDEAGLQAFKKLYLPAWEHTLALDTLSQPAALAHPLFSHNLTPGGYTELRLELDRGSRSGRIPAILLIPSDATGEGVVIVNPAGKAALLDPANGSPGPLAQELLKQRRTVLLLDAFLTGETADPAAEQARRPFENYFTTYNRTDFQERVNDLITACAYLRHERHLNFVTLIGQGRAGLWALAAAPAADAVAADCAQLDLTTDDALLADDLFTPCLRRLGDFRTAATLAAPHPLLLHNTGTHFVPTIWIEEIYRSLGKSNLLQVDRHSLSDREIVNWVAGMSPA